MKNNKFEKLSKLSVKIAGAMALGVVLVGAGATGASAYTTTESATATTNFVGTAPTITVAENAYSGEGVTPIVTEPTPGVYDITTADNGAVSETYTVTINDSSGTQNGWGLSVQATPFTQVNSADGAPVTLPTGLITLNEANYTNADTGIDGVADVYAGTPIDGSSAVAITDVQDTTDVNGAGGSGAGTTVITIPGFSVDLNKLDAYTQQRVIDEDDGSEAYESTITWTLTSAP